MKTTATNVKLRKLLNDVRNGRLIPQPEFQRRLVWTNKDKVAFLKTVLEGFPFPEIYIASGEVDTETGEGYELLVDGQQRITTLAQYFDGVQELKLPEGVPPYRELPAEDKEKFLEYDVVVRDLGKKDIGDIKEIFQRINSTSYSLNAMEFHNARYDGEFKKFGEIISQNIFFEDHRVFSANEIRRMEDVLYALSLTVTMMSTYFNRNAEIEPFLSQYNDYFEEKDTMAERFLLCFDQIEGCKFPADLRVWKKADLFTLVIELDRFFYKDKNRIDIQSVSGELLDFYRMIDNMDLETEIHAEFETYRKAALQATNDRSNRIRRGKFIYAILRGQKVQHWSSVLDPAEM